MVVAKWCVVILGGMFAAFLLADAIGTGESLFKAVAKPVDFDRSVAEQVDDCGYDMDEFTRRREPSAGCVAYIRDRIRAENRLRNVATVASGNGWARICVAELLELPDEELARAFAGWASRERHMLLTKPADLLIQTVLHKQYRCPPRRQGQG